MKRTQKKPLELYETIVSMRPRERIVYHTGFLALDVSEKNQDVRNNRVLMTWMERLKFVELTCHRVKRGVSNFEYWATRTKTPFEPEKLPDEFLFFLERMKNWYDDSTAGGGNENEQQQAVQTA